MIPANDLQISGPADTVGLIKTIAQADDAVMRLTTIISDIEMRLNDPHDDAQWQRRARKALSMKRAALAHVYVLRKEIRQDHHHAVNQRFVDEVKRLYPDLFYEIMDGGIKRAA